MELFRRFGLPIVISSYGKNKNSSVRNLPGPLAGHGFSGLPTHFSPGFPEIFPSRKSIAGWFRAITVGSSRSACGLRLVVRTKVAEDLLPGTRNEIRLHDWQLSCELTFYGFATGWIYAPTNLLLCCQVDSRSQYVRLTRIRVNKFRIHRYCSKKKFNSGL